MKRRRARGNRRGDVRGEARSTDERAAEEPAEGETESVGGPVGPKRAAATAAFVAAETNWRSQEVKHANPSPPSLSPRRAISLPYFERRKDSREERERRRTWRTLAEAYPWE